MKTHPLIDAIKTDHQEIIAKLEQASRPLSKETLISLAEFINLHHEKEDTIIHQHLLGVEQVRQGGPMCGLYFDFFLARRPEDLLKEHALAFQPNQQQEIFFKGSNPLQVPVSEHIAARILLKHLIDTFADQSEKDRNFEFFQLTELIRANAEKEDNCLSMMLLSVLSRDTLDNLHQAWLKVSVK